MLHKWLVWVTGCVAVTICAAAWMFCREDEFSYLRRFDPAESSLTLTSSPGSSHPSPRVRLYEFKFPQRSFELRSFMTKNLHSVRGAAKTADPFEAEATIDLPGGFIGLYNDKQLTLEVRKSEPSWLLDQWDGVKDRIGL